MRARDRRDAAGEARDGGATHVLELHHPRVGKQQRRVTLRNQT